MPLARSDEYGKFSLVGIAGYDRGINLATGGGLYHMMPLNAKLTLEHRLGNWSSAAELQLVDNKYDVETVRNELQTPGYALVNLRSSYQGKRPLRPRRREPVDQNITRRSVALI